MSEFICKVIKGLSKLKELNPRQKRLYELNPVVPEDDILDFEDANCCRLPEKYREFLLKAGNGGVGPLLWYPPFRRGL